MSEMTDDQLKYLTRRYRQLAITMGEIDAEMKEISQSINEVLPVGFTMDVDGIPITKKNGRRSFSLIKAVTLLLPEERDQFKQVMFDAKGVREFIESKGLLDEAMEDTGAAPSVKLR